MRKIIKEGVKTRVLMLSATPVNNRMADLRNQIAFATEGDDTALLEHGIASIDSTTRLAQKQFNRWLDLDDAERTPARLIEMLGFDYFTLLDLLTIARSRKHIEKYYGTRRDRPLPGPPEADQHQGRRGPRRRRSRRSATSTSRSAASTSPPTPRCATCCRTSRRPTTRSTAPRCSGGDGLLPAGGPRGEPDPPAAGQRAQAHGELGPVLRAHRRAPASRRGGHARAHRGAGRGAGGDRHRGRGPRRSRLREPARRPQGQGAAQGRGPRPLEAGPDRGPQPAGDAPRRGARRWTPAATPSSPPCAR